MDGRWPEGSRDPDVDGLAVRRILTDAYTVLEPTHDRVLATSLVAQWRFPRPAEEWQIAWDEVYAGVKTQLVNQFAEVRSLALQQTLYAMA